MVNSLRLSLYFFVLGAIAADDSTTDSLQYVGCFDLSYSVSRNYHKYLPYISFEGCVEMCKDHGPTRYIGIELSDDFCYCGDDIAESSTKREDAECNVKCSEERGKDNRTCGGNSLMSLFLTNKRVQLPNEDYGVSFVAGITTGVRLYNSSRNFQTLMVTNNSWAYTVDYHFEKRLLFAKTKREIIKVNVTSTFGPVSTKPTAIHSLSQCDGFAVDWVDDRVYWANCTQQRPPTIMSMGLDGEAVKTVVGLAGDHRNVKRMEVDPYNKYIFWLADTCIESYSMNAGIATANVSGTGIVVRALTLYRELRRVIYVGTVDQGTRLFCMDYLGNNNMEILRTPQMTSVFGLGLQGGFVYWINYAMSKDIIYKTQLKIDDGKNSHMLTTIDKAVWHMRVVHPEIQKDNSKNNPCTKKGCSHFCEVSSRTSAVCHCPKGSTLRNDTVTCNPSSSHFDLTTLTDISESPLPPKRHPTTTTTSGTERPVVRYGNTTYVGCVLRNAQLTMNRTVIYLFSPTLDKCIRHCERSSRIIGISVSDRICFCSSTMLPDSTISTEFLCTDPCPGTTVLGLHCGGEWALSVYQVDEFIPKDDENVRFLIGHTSSVRVYNSTAMDHSVTVFTQRINERAFAIDYHYAKNLVFVSTMKAVYKVNLVPNGNTEVSFSNRVVESGVRCQGFAVDWVYDRIFWMDCNVTSYSLNTADLSGRNATLLWHGSGFGVIRRMEVDPYRGKVFWINFGDIETCETTGNNHQYNLTSSSREARDMTLDIPARRLYYFAELEYGSVLQSVDYEGHDRKDHFKVPMSAFYGIGLINGTAYWVAFGSMDIMYKATLPSGQPQELALFKENSVWQMKILDPSLQSTPGPTLCPDGGYTCQAHTPLTAYTSGTHTALVVFILVGVVLLAGIILYVTDAKEVLKAKLFRSPYIRERLRLSDSISTFNPTDDRVNLM